MAAEEHTVKIKTTADLSGTDKAAQGLDNVGKSAKKASSESKSGFAKMKESIGGVRSSLGLLQSALTGFGVVGLVTHAIGLFEKWRDRINSAKDKAEELAKATKDAADAKAAERAAAAYEKLTEKIGKAAKARQRANEIEDMQISAADKLDDDTAELKMREEVAALDENDPLYEKKKERIEARYETEKLRRSVARQKRDANTAAERTEKESAAKAKEAVDISTAAEEDEDAATRYREKAAKEREAAKQDNEYDDTTFFRQWINNVKKFFSFDWDKMFKDYRTEKGDKKREKQEESAKEYDAKADEAEARAKEKRQAAAEAYDEAEHLKKKAPVQRKIAENADVATKAAEVKSATTVKKADKAVTDEEQRYADAVAAQENLRRQKAEVEARIQAEKDKKAAAGKKVYEAEGDLEMAKLGTGGQDVRPYHAALQEAKKAAQEVDLAADKAINALTKALSSISDKLKLADSVIKRNLKLQESYQADVPGV